SEETSAPQSLVRKEVLNKRSKRSYEPRPNWRSEPSLAAPDDIARQHFLLAALEDVFAPKAFDLKIRRDPCRERDELVVEQRHSDLDGCGHAHLVGVREIQARQERHRVEVQEPAQLV